MFSASWAAVDHNQPQLEGSGCVCPERFYHNISGGGFPMSIIELYRHFPSGCLQMPVGLGGTVCSLLQLLLGKSGRDNDVLRRACLVDIVLMFVQGSQYNFLCAKTPSELTSAEVRDKRPRPLP